MVGSGNKIFDVVSGSGIPVRSVRFLILHRSRNAGELAVVVVGGRAVHRGCCCGRVRCRFSRRRCQCDRSISGWCSGHRDLCVAVAGHFYPANLGNAVICRVIIPVVCGINHICHSAGQSGLFCIAGTRGLGHMVTRGDVHTMGSRRRSVPIYLNLFYALRRIRQNGGAIYFRCLILFRGFYYKWSFTVCSGTIGIVIEYTFGDGISISRGDSCRPTIAPPAPDSSVC